MEKLKTPAEKIVEFEMFREERKKKEGTTNA